MSYIKTDELIKHLDDSSIFDREIKRRLLLLDKMKAKKEAENKRWKKFCKYAVSSLD